MVFHDELANLLDLIGFGHRALGLQVQNLIHACFEQNMVRAFDPHLEAKTLQHFDQVCECERVVTLTTQQFEHQFFKLAHGWLQANLRMSTKWPCTAAAAAMAGLTKWVRPPAP